MRLLTTFVARRMLTSADRAEIEAAAPKDLTVHLAQIVGEGCVARIYADRKKPPIAATGNHPSPMTAFRTALGQVVR